MDHNGLFSKLWSAKPLTRHQSNSKNKTAPSFKPSLFTSNSLLSSVSSSTSPSSFYSGKIQYGGAMSAMRNNLSSPYVVPRVKKIDGRIQQSNRNDSSISSSSGSLSSTARKILQTLEKMSTPLRDLKKIPPPTVKVSRLFAGRQRKRPMGADSADNSKRFCPPSAGIIPVSQITINNNAKLPLDNHLATQSLIKVVSENRENITNISPNIPKGKPGVIASYSSSAGLNLQENSIPMLKSGGKIKNPRKNHSHYSALTNDEKIEEVNLPDVTFTVSKLPSFNFNQPDSTSTPALPKPLKKSKESSSLELQYTFSPPASTCSTKRKTSKQSTNKVHFGSPLTAASQKVTVSEKKVETPCSTPISSKLTSTGSVMDVLGSQNTSSTIDDASSQKPSLGALFKKPSDKWECEVCMIMNDKDKEKCAACEAPKPGGKANTISNANPTIQSKNSFVGNINSFSNVKPTFSFGTDKSTEASSEKFKFGLTDSLKETTTKKETENSTMNSQSEKNTTSKDETKSIAVEQNESHSSKWDCDVCLVPNKNDQSTCLSCENANPSKSFSLDSSASFKFGDNSTAVFKLGVNEPLKETSSTVSTTKNTTVIATTVLSTNVFAKNVLNSNTSTSGSLKTSFNITATKNKTSAPIDLPKSSGFNFGENTETKKINEVKTSAAIIPTSTNSFTFGVTENNKTAASNAGTTQSVFSSSSNITAVPKNNESVKSSLVQTTTSNVISLSTGTVNAMFSQSKSNTSSISFGSSISTTLTMSTSVVSPFGQSKPISTASTNFQKPTFSSFGEPSQQVADTNPLAKPNDVQGSVKEKQSSSLPKPTFSFGGKTDSNTTDNLKTKSFVFGSSVSPPATTQGFGSSSVKSHPFGGFGQPTKSLQETKLDSTSSKTSVFTGFGQQVPSSQENKSDTNTVKIPSFGSFGQSANTFGSQSTKSQDSSVSAVAKLPAFGGFGQSSNVSASQTQGNFSFGSAVSSASFFSSSSSPPKPSFSFGNSSSDAKPQFNTGNSMFGSAITTTTTTTKATTGFQFGSGSSNSSQTQTKTPFGAASQANTAPMFNFGSNNASNSTTTFQFGGSQASSSSGFNFGGSANANKNPAPSAGFSFGSSDSAAKPVFSVTSNFQFGSSQSQGGMQSRPDSTSNTGFQFTGSSGSAFPQASQPNPSSGMFSIGQSSRPRTMKQAKRRLRKPN